MSVDQRAWVRLEPVSEEGEGIYAQRLVLEFDNDWQDWTLEGLSSGFVRFTVELSLDMAEALPQMLGQPVR